MVWATDAEISFMYFYLYLQIYTLLSIYALDDIFIYPIVSLFLCSKSTFLDVRALVKVKTSDADFKCENSTLTWNFGTKEFFYLYFGFVQDSG